MNLLFPGWTFMAAYSKVSNNWGISTNGMNGADEESKIKAKEIH